MDIRIILHNSGEGKTFFELSEGKRPWDIIFIASKGKFSLSFQETGKEFIFEPYEVAYIPANTQFVRKVIEPVDYQQFNFQGGGEDAIFESLVAGKLSMPKKQVEAIMESANKLSLVPDDGALVAHSVEHILIENYIFSRGYERDVSKKSREVSDTVRYINENLCEHIDIEELARRVYLSHTGLIWKFKKELGVAPSDYIIMVRMRRAKQLLLEGGKPIGEIAEACGYANAYYFSNAFRRHTGFSPSDFRKTYVSLKK